MPDGRTVGGQVSESDDIQAKITKEVALVLAVSPDRLDMRFIQQRDWPITSEKPTGDAAA